MIKNSIEMCLQLEKNPLENTLGTIEDESVYAINFMCLHRVEPSANQGYIELSPLTKDV
jgi:hypothetical protein